MDDTQTQDSAQNEQEDGTGYVTGYKLLAACVALNLSMFLIFLDNSILSTVSWLVWLRVFTPQPSPGLPSETLLTDNDLGEPRRHQQLPTNFILPKTLVGMSVRTS